MNSGYKELGVGIYTGLATGKPRTYWTQDFGSKTADIYPIPSGAFEELASGTFTFLASYFDAAGKAPKASKIVLNSVALDLTLELGEAAKGTYMLNVPKGNGCMNYYFLFTDAAGMEWRYPETTTLSTVDGVVCDESAASIIQTGIKKPLGALKLRYFDLLGRSEN